MQILNVIINNIKNVKIINIYNEKNQESENQTRIIDCLLSINIGENLIANGDFNVRHDWWNFKIFNSIRAQNIIKWTKLNKLNLVNEHDLITWTRNSFKRKSISIIDLTFINQKIENKLINWVVDEKESIGFDHQIIRFDLITSFKNLVSNSTTSSKYNLNKANWKEFNKFILTKSNEFENQISQLIQSPCDVLQNLEKAVKLLKNLIVMAMNKHIFKSRICEK